MVLEVGLGGRLDAVNILDADVAVITSIAIDHQEWLGDNREVIGREKAGILREQQYFVCADENPPQTIVDIAAQLKTKSYFIGHDFSYAGDQKKWQWRGKNKQSNIVQLPAIVTPHLPLPSLAAALQAIYLFDIDLSPVAIEKALLELHLPGRFQKIIYQECEFILDVAHNPAATKYFAARLNAEPVTGKTFAIVAMMSDKDRAASLANLAELVDEWYLLDLSTIPRAATTAALTENIVELGGRIDCSGDIKSLIDKILIKVRKNDRVLVFGSFYTVAAALAYLQTDLQNSRGL
jgi:dihydrofolate synthase/folylpolyglutamate synthase